MVHWHILPQKSSCLVSGTLVHVLPTMLNVQSSSFFFSARLPDTQPSPETPNIETSAPLSVSEPASLTVPIQSVNTQFTPELSSTNQNNMWTVLVPVPYTIILPVQAAPAVAPQTTLPFFNFLLPTNTSSIPGPHLPNTGQIITTESVDIPRRSHLRELSAFASACLSFLCFI